MNRGMHFSFSDVFGQGFSVFFKNFFPFLLMAVLCYSPLLLVAMIMPQPSLEGMSMEDVAFTLLKGAGIVMVGGLICQQLLVSAVTFATVQELRGRHTTIGDALKVGFARMFPTLGVSLLAGLGILLGTIALIIPGLILTCMWYVAVPASVVERCGVGGALGRSSELTRGSRWTIFGIIIVVGLIGGVTNGILETLIVKKTQVGDVEVPASWRVYMVYEVGSSLVFGALGAAMAAAAYVGLRNDKEGVGVEDLARVFD